jgi:hypothetical protein
VFRGQSGEAHVILGLLHSSGVDATLSSDSMGGAYQSVGYAQGTRILVPADEEEDARRVIDEAEPIST